MNKLVLNPELFYEPDGAPTRCDCEPPQTPKIVSAEEYGSWPEEMRPALPGPVPDGFTLRYVAMCPDYPAGCGWIEEDWKEES